MEEVSHPERGLLAQLVLARAAFLSDLPTVRALLRIQCLLPAKHKDENQTLHSKDSFTPLLCKEKPLQGISRSPSS